MPLITKEKKEVFKTIPIKFEETLAERFLAYAEFLDSSKDHVVGEAMRYIMDRDKEFAAYLAANGQSSPKRRRTPAAKLTIEAAAAKVGS